MANHSVSSINLEPNNNAFLYALPSHTESNLSVVVTPIRKKRIEINGNYFKEKSPWKRRKTVEKFLGDTQRQKKLMTPNNNTVLNKGKENNNAKTIEDINNLKQKEK